MKRIEKIFIGLLLLVASLFAFGGGTGDLFFKIGPSSGSDVELRLGAGRLKWNDTSSKVQVSNDGVSFNDVIQEGDLASTQLLTANDVPTTTNLYAWHMSGQGSVDLDGWNGGVNLTQVGTITASTNHIGTAVFNDFDGSSDAVYATDANFDVANSSFTVFSWIKLTGTAGATLDVIASKYDGTNANNSFQLGLDASGLTFIVWVDGAGTTHQITDPDLEKYYDGNWHFVTATYVDNGADGWIMITLDGKIVGYDYGSQYATRNNSSGAKLTFAARDGDGTPSGHFQGQMSEFGYYYNGQFTFNELRRMYVTGSFKKGYLGKNDRVHIQGETGPLGRISHYSTASFNTSSSSYVDVTNMELRAPVAGVYRIRTTTAGEDQRSGASFDAGHYEQVAYNSTLIPEMEIYTSNTNAGSEGGNTFVGYTLSQEGQKYLSINDRVHVQVKVTADTPNVYVLTKKLVLELRDY